MNKNALKKYLTLSLIVGVCAGSFYPLHQKNMDINKDGIIDVCDVQQLVSAIISNDINVLPDINNDGKIDVKDLQILMKNMGKKQTTGKLKPEILSNIPRTNYNNQQLKKTWTYNSFINSNLICESKKFDVLSKRFAQNREDRESIVSSKLYGEKYLAYHISAKSPPNN
ncbi:MAG: dockerin type I domain-containing protein [Candidatus Hydrogenedens sp.]